MLSGKLKTPQSLKLYVVSQPIANDITALKMKVVTLTIVSGMEVMTP